MRSARPAAEIEPVQGDLLEQRHLARADLGAGPEVESNEQTRHALEHGRGWRRDKPTDDVHRFRDGYSAVI